MNVTTHTILTQADRLRRGMAGDAIAPFDTIRTAVQRKWITVAITYCSVFYGTVPQSVLDELDEMLPPTEEEPNEP